MEIFEQLGIDPKLIVVNIIGFILLLALLKKFLYGPITQMLADRAANISSTYSAAEAEKAAMEQLRQDYEQRLSAIEAEAKEKINAAVKEGQVMRNDILADARTKAEAIMQRGEEELSREREKTLQELREEVVGIALGAAAKLIEKSMDEETHRKLVANFVADLGAAK